MLKIKLIRFGKKNQPHYRIVVQEARTKRDGKYTAKLGHYAPAQEPKVLEINLEEYKKWMTKGAQPTETVASLVKRFETGNPFPPKKKRPSKKQLAKDKVNSEAREGALGQSKAAEEPKEVTPEKPAEDKVEEVVELKKEAVERTEEPAPAPEKPVKEKAKEKDTKKEKTK